MYSSPHRLPRSSLLALLVVAGAFTACQNERGSESTAIPEGVYIEEPAPQIEPTSTAEEQDARTNALEASCARGNDVACDELAATTDSRPEVEDPSAVEAMFAELDDEQMAQLAAECIAGDMVACDRLFWGSPVDSDYETLGLECGGHGVFPCTGQTSDAPSDLSDLSDDVVTDLADVMVGLASACVGGDRGACDDLWWMSPPDSSWELLAEACGGNEGSFPCSV